MTARAWIVAIEHYPEAEGLASRTLPGTQRACIDQYAWLTGERGLDPSAVWINSDLGDATDLPSDPPHRRGARGSDLCDTMEELTSAGAGSTDVFLFFFSGHGFSLVDPGAGAARPSDVLVTAGFKTLPRSGRECLPLPALMNDLRAGLGPGEHFYFIDACRNTVGTEQVNPVSCGYAFGSAGGEPSVFSLFSTRRGVAAAVQSGFADHLVAGLRGSGTAKRWDVDPATNTETLGIFFDSLQLYVESCLPDQEVADEVVRRGRATGLLHRLRDVPVYRCTLEVDGATDHDQFKLVARGRRTPPTTATFSGGTYVFEGRTDEYFIDVFEVGGAETPLRSTAGGVVDLLDHVTLRFTRPGLDETPGPGAVGGGDRGVDDGARTESVYVRFGGHRDVEVVIRQRRDPTQWWELDDRYVEVPAGPYAITAHDRHGHVLLASTTAQLAGIEPLDVLGSVGWAVEPMRDRLGAFLPIVGHGPSFVELHERAGAPLVDGDLSVWLAMAAAWQLIDRPAAVPPPPPLFDTTRLQHLSAPVIVLAGLGEAGLSVAARPGRQVDAEPSNAGGVHWAVLDTAPGPQLLGLSGRAMTRRTLVSHTFTDRATVVTLARRAGQPAIGQFSFPLAGRAARLDPDVRAGFEAVSASGPLNWVRWAAQAQRAFAHHHAMVDDDVDNELWDELLGGKWLDPIMSVLAAYELLRSGETAALPVVVQNLRTHFPGLADVDHIDAALRRQGTPPASRATGVDHPPLVLEGWRGAGMWSRSDLPTTHIDHTGPWTAWLNAPPDGGD